MDELAELAETTYVRLASALPEFCWCWRAESPFEADYQGFQEEKENRNKQNLNDRILSFLSNNQVSQDKESDLTPLLSTHCKAGRWWRFIFIWFLFGIMELQQHFSAIF